MTCCGFQIISPDRAVAWVDTEVFVDNAPDGHNAKLFVGALAATVAIGTGRMAIVFDAAEVVIRSLSFDDAVAALPGTLRRAVRSYSLTEIAARAPIEGGAVALVGFSRKYGTIIGAVFPHGRDFEPVIPMRSFLSPPLPNGSCYAGNRDAVISIAAEQLVELQCDVPLATGGALVVAEIGRGGVRCGPVFDMRQGRELRSGWRRPAGDE